MRTSRATFEGELCAVAVLTSRQGVIQIGEAALIKHKSGHSS